MYDLFYLNVSGIDAVTTWQVVSPWLLYIDDGTANDWHYDYMIFWTHTLIICLSPGFMYYLRNSFEAARSLGIIS